MLAIIVVWTKRNYKLAMLGVISKSVSQRIIKNPTVNQCRDEGVLI